jgi:hypothetical protein
MLQRSATVDIDANLIMDANSNGVRTSVLDHIDILAKYTGTDIFLLSPKSADPENLNLTFSGTTDNGLDQRFRVAIYGDMESVEHAKTRVLIMIDQVVSVSAWTVL